MKVKHRYFIFLNLIVLFLSCSSKEQILTGAWSIGSLKSNSYDYGDSLLGNNFFFIDGGKLGVPRMISHDGEFSATWDIGVDNKQIDSLFIKSENYIYEGKYKVHFLINNSNSRLFIELKSISREIILYKYFKSIEERDSFILFHEIDAKQISDDFFPQLKQFPDNRKTLE